MNRKFKFSKILFTSLLLLFLVSNVSAQVNSKIWGFENQSFNGFGTYEDGNLNDRRSNWERIVTDPALDEYSYESFNDGNGADTIYRNLTNGEYSKLTFSIYINQTNSNRAFSKVIDSNDNQIMFVKIDPDNNEIDVCNDGTVEGSSNFEQWEQITFNDTDYSSETFDMYNDGTRLVNDASFCSSGGQVDAWQIDVASGSGGHVYLDDVTIDDTATTNVNFYNFTPADQSTAYINGNQKFEVTVEANSTQYNDIDIEGIFDGVINETFNHPADGTNQTYSFTIKDFNNTGSFNYRFSAISDSPNGDFIDDTEIRTLNVQSDSTSFTLNNPNDNRDFYKPGGDNKSINFNVDVSTGSNESWRVDLNVTKPNSNVDRIVSSSQPSGTDFNINTSESFGLRGTYNWVVKAVGQTSGDTVSSNTRTFTLNDESATINFIKPDPSISKTSDASFNVNQNNQDKFFVINKSADKISASDSFESDCTVDYNNYSGCYKYKMSDSSAFQNAPMILWNQTLERNGDSDFMEFGITYADQANPTVYLVQNGSVQQGNANNAVNFNVPQDDPLVNMSLDYFPSQDQTEITVTNLKNGDTNSVNQSIDPDKPFKVAVGGSDSDTTGNKTAYLFYGNSTFDKLTKGSSSAYVKEIPFETEVSANTENNQDATVEFIYNGNIQDSFSLKGDGTTKNFDKKVSFQNTIYNKFASINVVGTDNQGIGTSENRNVSVVQPPEFNVLRPENNSRVELDSVNNKVGEHETSFEGNVEVGEAGKAVIQLVYPDGTVENVTSKTFTRNDVGNNETLLQVKELNNISVSEKIGESVLISDYYNWSLKYYGSDSLETFDSDKNIYRYVSELQGAIQKILNVVIGFFGSIEEFIENNLGDAGKIFASIILSSILGGFVAGLAKTFGADSSSAGLIFIAVLAVGILGFAVKGWFPAWILGALVLIASGFGVKSVKNFID